MSLESRLTNLPTDAPPHIVGGISNYRWGELDAPGPAVGWTVSLEAAVARENINAWVLVADETNTPGVDQLRLQLLEKSLGKVHSIAPLFFLTPETQTGVAEMVQQSTGIEMAVVQAILNEGGYANQRVKLDSVVGGLAIGKHPIKILSLDDDIVIPEFGRQIRPEKLPKGISPLSNSQVLFRFEGDEDDLNWFDLSPNWLSAMFDHLGITIEDIRRQTPDYQAKVHVADSMQDALEKAVMAGSAQFQFTYTNEDEDIPDAGLARVIATQSIKSKRPDYVASRVAAGHLMAEFPAEEIPLYAFPSGSHVPFAFASVDTNIDSGTLARHMDDDTARWPWWFVSDRAISAQNPTRVVTGQYRADNDFLPSLFKRIYKRTSRQVRAVYEAGVPTQFLHERAATGYRQATIEQACASAVGKIPAYEAMNHLVFSNGGQASLEPIPDSYEAPKDHVKRVYELLYRLGGICRQKIGELDGRKLREDVDVTEIDRKIQQYGRIFVSIFNKLAEFDQEVFAKYLDIETRDQIRFYSKILEAMPIVMEAVGNIIGQGNYPVVEIYRRK